MSQDTDPIRQNRLERVLAYMVAGVIGVSIIAFLAVIIGTASGLTQTDLGTGAWPVVVLFPLIGLPIAFILIIVLLITSSVRRSREARASRS